MTVGSYNNDGTKKHYASLKTEASKGQPVLCIVDRHMTLLRQFINVSNRLFIIYIYQSQNQSIYQHYIGHQKANRMTNYQILRVFHMQTLDAYCTSILIVITVMFSGHLDLVKMHVKFYLKRTIALYVIA